MAFGVVIFQAAGQAACLPSNDFYGKPAICSLRFVKAREDASFHSIFIEI